MRSEKAAKLNFEISWFDQAGDKIDGPTQLDSSSIALEKKEHIHKVTGKAKILLI